MNMARMKIAANLPPVQFGFRLDTIRYQEQFVSYQGQTVLYYQFTLCQDTDMVHIVPDGCMDVLICCDPSRPHSLICGTILQGESIRFHKGATYFGIRLTPTQSLYIRPAPFRDLVDRQLPLGDVMQGVGNLCDAIAEQECFSARVALFEQHLLPKLLSSDQSSLLLDYCLRKIYTSKGNVTVEQLAEEIGVSTRYLRKKFVDTLGLSPKQYSRITRFQNTLSSLLTQKRGSGIIAIEHGYYDQAHFIKDFKYFTMFTPMQISLLIEQVMKTT